VSPVGYIIKTLLFSASSSSVPVTLSSYCTLSPNTLAPASPPLPVGASANSIASPAEFTLILLSAVSVEGVSVKSLNSEAPEPPLDGVTNSIPSSVSFTATILPAFPA